MIYSQEQYAKIKEDIKEQLAQVDSFIIEFSCPPSVQTLKHVKAGSKRQFKRKEGTSYFLMSNSKICVGAATVAQVVSQGHGKLVLPEGK